VKQLVLLAISFAALGSLSPSAQSSPPPISQGQPPLVRSGQRTNAVPHKTLTSEDRLAFIRRAQVWTPTDIPKKDLRTGPAGSDAFQPNQSVTCVYADEPKHGATRKFHCTLPGGDVVKVRYGLRNGEVQASVLATRLLWALGFQADRVYPVRVTCRGCSSDPWTVRGSRNDVHQFDPAVIERKPLGHEMFNDNDKKSGWSWRELDLVDARAGGAPQAQRDALKLLAVFMQHTDSKSDQQRLLCANGFSSDGQCREPFLMLHDVGMTFGHANFMNNGSSGSVNFENWSTTPIWRNAARCVGHLRQSHTGTLGDPRISEAGRKFLADLLAQLSDQQVRDLFEIAGVARRADSDGKVSAAPIQNWVSAFNEKRNEIVSNRCR
jgi:hypothetical protein